MSSLVGLLDRINELEAQLKNARAEVERLTLDVHILTEELLHERKQKQDER